MNGMSSGGRPTEVMVYNWMVYIQVQCGQWIVQSHQVLMRSPLSSIPAYAMKKGKLKAYAIKRVAAGARAHLPTPWLFEPAKRPEDRVDYCPD